MITIKKFKVNNREGERCDDEKNQIISEIPLERIGNVNDIADCVLFLDKSSYITGQVIQVNGGWNI